MPSPGFLCLSPEPAFLLEAFPHPLRNLFLQSALRTDQHCSLYPESQSPVAKRKRFRGRFRLKMWGGGRGWGESRREDCNVGMREKAVAAP